MNVTENNQISSGTRVSAMILDHFFMTMIAMVFFIPGMISIFSNEVTHEQTSFPFMGGSFVYSAIFGFSLYFCKDCINGRSIAKRVLKLQVVDDLSGQVANPIKCLIRNLTIIFWPVEVVVALTNPSRRLGDRIAGTKLVVFDPILEQPKIKIGQVLIPVAIAVGVMFLFMLPYIGLMSAFEQKKINYIESSYNDLSSKETEKLFSDSLGQYLTASVMVFDKIKDKPFKYVSVIFVLKENYLDDDKDYEKIESVTLPLLFAKFPEESIIGQVKYTYQSGVSSWTRTLPLNWAAQK